MHRLKEKEGDILNEYLSLKGRKISFRLRETLCVYYFSKVYMCKSQ